MNIHYEILNQLVFTILKYMYSKIEKKNSMLYLDAKKQLLGVYSTSYSNAPGIN